jgi:hypothetical protein
MPHSPAFQKQFTKMKRDTYILHVHTASDGLVYTLHILTAGGWKGIHPASILLAVEMDTPCTPILLTVERDTPCTSNDGWVYPIATLKFIGDYFCNTVSAM